MLDPSQRRDEYPRSPIDRGDPFSTERIPYSVCEASGPLEVGLGAKLAVSPRHVASLLRREELGMPLVLELEVPNYRVDCEADQKSNEGGLPDGTVTGPDVSARSPDSPTSEGQDLLADTSFDPATRSWTVDPFLFGPNCIRLAPFGGDQCCVDFDVIVPEFQRYVLRIDLQASSKQPLTQWRNSSLDPDESEHLLEGLNIGLDEKVDLVCLDGNSFGSLNKSANPKRVTEWILKLLDHIPSDVREKFIGIRKAGDEFILVFRHDPENDRRIESVTRLFEESIHRHFDETELDRARTVASFKYRTAQFEMRVREELTERGQEVTLENFLKVGMCLLEKESPSDFAEKVDNQAFTILKRSFESSPSQQVYPEHLQSGEFLLHFFNCAATRNRSDVPESSFARGAIQAVLTSRNLEEFRSKLNLLGGIGTALAQGEVSSSYRARALFTLLPKDEGEAKSLGLFGPGTFTLVKATVSAEALVRAGKVVIAELFEEVDRLKREGINNRGSLDIATAHLTEVEPSCQVSHVPGVPFLDVYRDSVLASYLLEIESSLKEAKTGIKGLPRSSQLSGPLWLYFPVVLDPDRLGFPGPSLLFMTRMIDISNFGAFNQRFGHDSADQILAHLHEKALELCPTALCTITKGGRLAFSWVVDCDLTDERHVIIDGQMARFHDYAKTYLSRLVDSDPEIQVIGCNRAATDDYLRERNFPLGAQDSFLGNANSNVQHTIRLTPADCWTSLSELIYPDLAGV